MKILDTLMMFQNYFRQNTKS